MSATEHLSQLFDLELDLLSERHNVASEDVLGQQMAVELDLPEERTRYFTGIVSRFSYEGTSGRYAVYHASLRPWLWFLTRTADCRIFQEKTVPDIIKEIFREHGFTDFDEKLNESYRTWEYCVQYRETDFNFVSRLMEQEGIYYFFTHDKDKHALVLCDSYSAHETAPGYEEIPYFPPDEPDRRIRDHIFDWSVVTEVQSGVYALNDFDFERPKADLNVRLSKPQEHAGADMEIYDYPGEYLTTGDGQTYSRVRLEELQAQFEQAQGQGNARGLAVGRLFQLKNYPREDQNREYLIVSGIHHIRSDEYISGPSGAEEETYSCRFTAMDSRQPFRPPRITPKPIVQGPQTAIVVGKKGEEIWTDKHGRVKVQFHWDRRGKMDENSSCWIRVAQSWAGKSWGGITLPRIGQEVIVEFLEGDPDRPIITGRVYNGSSMPPYGLPDNATMSTLKSNSSRGGGGFNEIRFEDKKDKEQVFIHAERTQHNRVKASSFEWVGKDRHTIVVENQYEQVDKDKHLTVKGDQNEKVDGSVSLSAGADLQQKVTMNAALDAGSEIHLKAGMNVVIEAGVSVTLKAGGGFVVVGPAGVTISGTPVLINSGGSAGSGSGASPDAATPPEEAVTAKPGEVDEFPTARVAITEGSNPTAAGLQAAAASGAPFCEQCEALKAQSQS